MQPKKYHTILTVWAELPGVPLSRIIGHGTIAIVILGGMVRAIPFLYVIMWWKGSLYNESFGVIEWRYR